MLTRLAPAVDTFIASLRDGGAWSLANYAELGATTFREAVVTTVVFNAIINPAQVLVSYALAVVLSQTPARRRPVAHNDLPADGGAASGVPRSSGASGSAPATAS